MLVYDYSVTDGYNLFIVEWKEPAPLRVMGALSNIIKYVKITKEGTVIIRFGSHDKLPADVRETVSPDDILRALILYLPNQLVEINHQGEPQSFIRWTPTGIQGSQSARIQDGEYELMFICESITKKFLNNKCQ